ncbi:MAG: isoprenyl transferase [Thermoflexales bacterium]|nr:isoprenyl transferase [Thermoflexales bacterium]
MRQTAPAIAPATASERVPQHIAIIMDGNGRWAKRQNRPRIFGHRAGTENIRRVLRACVESGVKVLTLYAFSTENWTRPQDEVSGLMGIFQDVLEREIDELDSNGVQIRHLGRIDRLSPALQAGVRNAIARTAHNDRIILNVALNYGGRAEIVDAVRALVEAGTSPERIDEDAISRHLYTADLPDPDLIVRTSGEFRTSNFLIWQAAYAEYYVTETYWPDFDEREVRKAIEHFGRRERRFGGVTAR